MISFTVFVLTTHTVLHTGDIPELGSLANRRQTFTQAFQSRDTHSDNMRKMASSLHETIENKRV